VGSAESVLSSTQVTDLFARMRKQDENLTRFSPVPEEVHAPAFFFGWAEWRTTRDKDVSPKKKAGWAAVRTALLFKAQFIVQSKGTVRPSVASENRLPECQQEIN
jgi:hypothetical protein